MGGEGVAEEDVQDEVVDGECDADGLVNGDIEGVDDEDNEGLVVVGDFVGYWVSDIEITNSGSAKPPFHSLLAKSTLPVESFE